MLSLSQFDDSSEDDGTVFRDVIMLVLFGFVTIVVLLLPHLNPPVEPAEDIQTPGNIMVEVRWPDDVDADVDLWVEAPGDVPVGYSNKDGQYFNLLRDDLGQRNDPAGLNYEVAFSRGVPEGEYTVNLHLYRKRGDIGPVEVVVVVSIRDDETDKTIHLLDRTVTLSNLGEELTVVRFSLDEDGEMVEGSMHNLQRNLRTSSAG